MRARAGCSPRSSCGYWCGLLAGTKSVTLDPDRPAEREVALVGGWARVPVLLD
jgi:hypothetical protein